MWYLIFPLVLLLTACASQPKHYEPSNNNAEATTGMPASWGANVNERSHANELSLTDLLSSPEIAHWLQQVRHHNPGLAKAHLDIERANLLFGVAQSSALPEVNFSANASRQKTSGEGSRYASSRALGLSASWELDLWGRLADERAQARTHIQISELDYAALERSVTAQALKQWLAYLNTKARMALETKRLDVLRANEQIIKRRYRSGLLALGQFEAAKSRTQRQLAALAVLQAELSNTLNDVRAVTGLMHAPIRLSEQWPAIALPHVTVPAQVLAQRPDVQTALLRIRAADTATRIRDKNLLPSFRISLDTTMSTSGSQNLLKADPLWSLLGQLTQPVFNRGRLKKQVQLSELEAKSLLIDYQNTLLQAYTDVNKQIARANSVSRQTQALERALAHAQSSEQNFAQRYRGGIGDVLGLVEAQQTTFDLQSTLLDLNLQRVTNRIDLAMALGLPLHHSSMYPPLSDQGDA